MSATSRYSKPGKSPYPMQERQDIVNRYSTGIAWGYERNGPAQCALTILMITSTMKNGFGRYTRISNSGYLPGFRRTQSGRLTGRQLENAISKMSTSVNRD